MTAIKHRIVAGKSHRKPACYKNTENKNIEMRNQLLSLTKTAAIGLLILCLISACKSTTDTNNESPQPVVYEGAAMQFIENDFIRVGIDLNVGGAITYIADKSNNSNMINNFDWGRQVQMSFFAGPVPYEENGKKPSEHWAHIGWNPIQAGDAYHNGSKVIEHSNTGNELYVSCIPMQWPLDNVPGECVYKSWITLDGYVVKVRAQMLNNRSDQTQYQARDNELPAVYTNGPWYRLVTYTGTQPYTNDEVTEIPIKEKGPGIFPWSRFTATENWAALLDKNGHGLGVWNDGAAHFLGGFAGEPGAGGTKDNPTGYLTPIHKEVLDHNITYDYNYELIVGDIESIRKHVYDHTKGVQELFDFSKDRQHWIYYNTQDQGWPINEGLNFELNNPRTMAVSPEGCWNTTTYHTVKITAAFTGSETSASLGWNTYEDERGTANFEVIPDGVVREYVIPLTNAAHYKGSIKNWAVLLPEGNGKKLTVNLRKVEIIK